MNFLLAIMLTLSSAEVKQQVYAYRAHNALIAWAWLSSPPSGKEYGQEESRYEPRRFHRVIASYLHDIESGKINRLEIEMPPRMGKSELSVRKFVPWFCGRHPNKSVIVVTHTDQLAREHGQNCRDLFRSPAYHLAFGRKECQLRDDSQATDRLMLAGGAVLTFTGRSGLGAGLGADLLVFDDFFKNTEEAESQLVRDNAWRTFISDCQSRLNNQEAPVVLIGTRRHEDDPQGRLFDSTNPHYDARESARWTRIRLPAMAEANDPLGRALDEPLWPERFSRTYYEGRRNHVSDIVRQDYQTQDQCNPTPTEGRYFKKTWMRTYEASELPKQLRIYAASDHAYRKDQHNDRQCLLVVGIDPSDTIWVLPDTWWARAETDEMVEKMCGIIEARKPAVWWAAKDAISGSVGPFLHKRLRERKQFAWFDEVREDKDLERRAQSIRNRMAMGMVRFPKYWPAWGEAENELLTFPAGKHDDFVAALALIGMGLDRMLAADTPKPRVDDMPKPGTLAWVKKSTEYAEAERNRRNSGE